MASPAATLLRKKWSSSEDEKLLRLVREAASPVDWKKIANALPGRTARQCCQHWKETLDPSIKKGLWNAEEDRQLVQLREKLGDSWTEISARITGRTDNQCRSHWRNVLDPSIKKETWSAEEDRHLSQLLEKLGGAWAEISKSIDGRSEMQCRSHWFNVIDTSTKKGPWTIDEDRHLAKLQEEFGSSWVEIGKRMDGRSEMLCRIRGTGTRTAARSTKDASAPGKNVAQTPLRELTSSKKARVHKFWTKAENEEMLRLMREAGSAVNWKEIADALPERNISQCRIHWTETLDPSIKKGPWSSEEESLLKQLHDQFDDQFTEISKGIPGRPRAQCRNHWIRKLKASSTEKDFPTPGIDEVPMELRAPNLEQNARTYVNWTQAEDEALLRLVREAGPAVDWAQLARSMPGRSEVACQERWIVCLNPSGSLTAEEDHELEGYQTTVWTLYEDEALTSLHAIHGDSWGLIAQQMAGRSHVHCRDRWLDALDPSLSTGSWTSEEDTELVRLYGEYGKQWSLIAEGIPGHDEFECINRCVAAVGKEQWTSAEDAKLRTLRTVHGTDWDAIADGIPNRTSMQCQYRAFVLLELNRRKNARSENSALPESPRSKRARTAKDSVADSSQMPRASDSDGFTANRNHGEDDGSSSNQALRLFH